jgi:aspartate/methionine/tyrosine aminotransferase
MKSRGGAAPKVEPVTGALQPMLLPPFKLERYFARYEFTVPYNLCCSDCQSLTIEQVLALEPGAHERFQRLGLGYTESLGAPELRQAIGRLYTTIGPEQVLVHCGAEEAIFLFMHAALQAGDHVIVHWPCYQSLEAVARAIGCDITHWKADRRRGWALDPDDFKRAIRANTKAVIINTPHNPTGYLMPREQFRLVNQMAQDSGIVVFSDEVYRELEHDRHDRLDAACDINEQAVSLGVMSKTYGLPGLRIGWIATHHREIYNAMAVLKDYTTICSSAPSEFLAAVALRHRHPIVQRNIDIILRNLDILDDFFARHAGIFSWQRPKAGPIAFPRLRGMDSDAFCHELAQQAGVLLLPGAVYDDRHHHVRMGFGRENLPQAVERLEAFLAEGGG